MFETKTKGKFWTKNAGERKKGPHILKRNVYRWNVNSKWEMTCGPNSKYDRLKQPSNIWLHRAESLGLKEWQEWHVCYCDHGAVIESESQEEVVRNELRLCK